MTSNAWILSLGTELTLGQSVDTNSAWLSHRLAELGIRCERHVTVADDLLATRDLLRDAAARAVIVLVTGGLGPTDDDLTRQALADAAGQPLVEDAASLEQMREFFAARNRAMPDRNRVRALRPAAARAIPNSVGTAPGIRLELGSAVIYALPGVPFEMRTMFDEFVRPELAARGGGAVLLARRIRCYGSTESEIGERIADLMTRGRNPEVGTTAELGEIGIRIYASGDSPAQAEALLDRDEAEIRERLGRVVYGRESDTLAGVVGELLAARGQTLATAESCTGGMVSTLLTDVSGSSRYYLGGVVAYDNRVKLGVLGVRSETIAEHGAVSAAGCREMADGARARLAADYVLATTGIAGPTGGSAAKPVGLVYVGLAHAGGTIVRELHLGAASPRDSIRVRASRGALNLLRLHLLE
jgi:nicotinamide-nucleotide amidase